MRRQDDERDDDGDLRLSVADSSGQSVIVYPLADGAHVQVSIGRALVSLNGLLVEDLDVLALLFADAAAAMRDG